MLENEHLTSNMLTSGLKLGCKRDFVPDAQQVCPVKIKWGLWRVYRRHEIRVKLKNNYALMRHIKLFLYKLILWTKLLLFSP